MIVTGVTVGLVKWIIDYASLVYFYFLKEKLTNLLYTLT